MFCVYGTGTYIKRTYIHMYVYTYTHYTQTNATNNHTLRMYVYSPSDMYIACLRTAYVPISATVYM